jgi:polyhydroxybutyrate depolymerase
VERIALEVGDPPREYRLFRPGARGLPLVVFLPGTGAMAEWADDETGWSRLAEREGFALAIPEGLPPDPDHPPTFLTNPPRWDDGSPGSAELGARNAEPNDLEPKAASPDSSVPRSALRVPSSHDVAFLTAVIDDATSRTGADPGRVFVSGFSNGAGMAFRLAAERADRMAAVAPVAGYCWVNPKPARPVPTLYVVGTTDPLVPLRGGEVRSPWQHRYVRRPPVADTLERWAKAIGCDPIPRTESDSGGVRVDTYPGPVPFRVVMVAGLGHHWPGGKGRLNPRIAGSPSDLVNGTELVWEFFKGIA